MPWPNHDLARIMQNVNLRLKDTAISICIGCDLTDGFTTGAFTNPFINKSESQKHRILTRIRPTLRLGTKPSGGTPLSMHTNGIAVPNIIPGVQNPVARTPRLHVINTRTRSTKFLTCTTLRHLMTGILLPSGCSEAANRVQPASCRWSLRRWPT